MKKIFAIFGSLLVTAFVLSSVFLPSTAQAAPYTAPCDADEVAIRDKPSDPNSDSHMCCPKSAPDKTPTGCIFAKYINPLVALLSAIVGIVVVGSIVVGGIEYGSSGGDPQKSAKGKGRIVKALFGLMGFLFLFSAFHFMSPGGTSGADVTVSGPGVAKQCSKTFLGMKPWFAYLPDTAFEGGTCEITKFEILGDQAAGKPSYVLPIAVAIVDMLVRVAGMVAVGFVIVAGIQFITSQGDPEHTKRARQSIINALIGVVIAIVAAPIVSYIGGQLAK